MNGRTHEEETPEGRIAAAARSLAIRMQTTYAKTGVGPKHPDYADYREALRPFIEKELLLARIDEARGTSAQVLTSRMRELSGQVTACELAILKVGLS